MIHDGFIRFLEVSITGSGSFIAVPSSAHNVPCTALYSGQETCVEV